MHSGITKKLNCSCKCFYEDLSLLLKGNDEFDEPIFIVFLVILMSFQCFIYSFLILKKIIVFIK